VPASLGVNAFYKKYTDAHGIPVLSSEKAPDAALLVARDIVNTMLAARPDLRKALIARKWRTGVIAEVGRVFTTHHIRMDVFHGKRIRPVKCPA
jgi:hypothetical protein